MTSQAVEVGEIGRTIRRLREARDMTLAALATDAGISKAHLSRVESGERSPSIGLVGQLAQSLGVHAASLLPGVDDASEVVRDGEPFLRSADLSVRSLSNRAGSFISPLRVTVPPGRVWQPLASHPGEEWIFVLRGIIRVLHGSKSHDLGVGDALHFSASEPHRLEATTEAELIIVTTKEHKGEQL